MTVNRSFAIFELPNTQETLPCFLWPVNGNDGYFVLVNQPVELENFM